MLIEPVSGPLMNGSYISKIQKIIYRIVWSGNNIIAHNIAKAGLYTHLWTIYAVYMRIYAYIYDIPVYSYMKTPKKV